MGLFVPAFILMLLWNRFIMKRRIGIKFFLISLLCLLAGGGLYAFVFFRDVAGNMNSAAAFMEAFGRTWLKATGGEFRDYMFTENLSPRELRFWRWNYPFLWLMNFPSAAILLGFYGLIRWLRNREMSGNLIFLLTAMAAQILWSANYFIWDMFAFSMPVYLMFGVFAGYGLIKLAEAAAAAKFRHTLPCRHFSFRFFSIRHSAAPEEKERTFDNISVITRLYPP